MANIRYILFWVSGRAIDSGGQKRGFKIPSLFFLFCFLLWAVLTVQGLEPRLQSSFFLFFASFFYGLYHLVLISPFFPVDSFFLSFV